MSEDRERMGEALADAEFKAWDALCRYKFFMFGYWAAAWVSLNTIGRFKRPCPFAELVQVARRIQPSSIPMSRAKREALANG